MIILNKLHRSFFNASRIFYESLSYVHERGRPSFSGEASNSSRTERRIIASDGMDWISPIYTIGLLDRDNRARPRRHVDKRAALAAFCCKGSAPFQASSSVFLRTVGQICFKCHEERALSYMTEPCKADGRRKYWGPLNARFGRLANVVALGASFVVALLPLENGANV